MRKPSPLVRIAARNGAIAAILGSVMLITLFFISDVHPLLINPIFDMRLFLFGVFIFFTLKEFKDRFTEGILYFWQGMIGSYVFLAVFASLMGVMILVFSQLYPEFVVSYTEQSVALLRQNTDFVEKIGKEQFERNFSNAAPTNGFRLGFIYFLVSFAMGFFISVIVSIIARKQPKT